jgi:hypothetical protein
MSAPVIALGIGAAFGLFAGVIAWWVTEPRQS